MIKVPYPKWSKQVREFGDACDEPDLVPLYGWDCYEEGLNHGMLFSLIVLSGIYLYLSIKSKKKHRKVS